MEEKRRLLWQCRRGMLEVELLLQAFVDSAYDDITARYQDSFHALLLEPDPLILEYLLEQRSPPAHFKPVVDAIRHASHALD